MLDSTVPSAARHASPDRVPRRSRGGERPGSASSSSTTTRSSGWAFASSSTCSDDIEVVGEAADGSEGVAMARRLDAGRRPDGPPDAEHGRRHRDRPDQGRAARDRDRHDDQLHRGGEGHRRARGRRVGLRAQGRRGRGGRARRSAPPTPARSTSTRRSPGCSPSGCGRRTARPEPVEPLTDREKDVIRLLGQGMSNKEIGVRAVHHRADGPDLRLEHPRQARARVADAGRALGGRAQARRASPRLTMPGGPRVSAPRAVRDPRTATVPEPAAASPRAPAPRHRPRQPSSTIR